MLARSQLILLAALAASVVVTLFSNQIDPYYLLILINVGINIILAVSLNLINGYTGQFSLGHAGFMAVGAYTSSAMTLFFGPKFFSSLGSSGVMATGVLFLSALILGGLVAATTGLIVGEDPGASKLKKAQGAGVALLSESELKALLAGRAS